MHITRSNWSMKREKGNNMELLGLTDAVQGWEMAKDVSECEAACHELLVGGQCKSSVMCNCKSACDSNKCSCFKAGHVCFWACHCNNHKCKNHERDD
jgi:hypothetical protein